MRVRHLNGSVFSGFLVFLLIVVGVLLLSGSAKAAYHAAATGQSERKAVHGESCQSCAEAGPNDNTTDVSQPPDSGQGAGCTTAVNLVLDDGTVENSVGWTDSTTSYAAIWLNRSSPPAASFPMNLTQLSIKWPNSSAMVGKTIALLVYRDADADGNPANAVKVAQVNGQTINVADGATFQNYPVSINITGPGDVYYGFSDTYNAGGVSPRTFPSPLDTTAPQERSWVAAQNDDTSVDYDNLGNNDTLATIDSVSGGFYAGNWVIRATGTGGSGDQFADVPSGSTFYDFVRCLACRQIVSGYPCGGTGEPCPGSYYRPGANVTRGQLSKIIANSAGLNDPIPAGQQQFADVPPGSPFYEFVERLAETGAISGYPCGGAGEACDAQNRPYFRANSPATRGQISKIVSIAAGFEEDVPADQQTFTDVPKDSPFWAYIERLSSRGVISGYGDATRCAETGAPCFRYNDLTTRGQMAKIAANAFFPKCQTPARK
ncbi:MAG: S-layer homology domain-containing protein [Chloroflexota bacterium]|nr:S-layer homology domain-containing protein [Chloroflexota bacterium]MDQ5867747.1 S-layer homology domain-containing protein [Chloroflexota bacterium]